MIYATIIEDGDGSTVEFNVTFDYIQRDHVSVYRVVKATGAETELTVQASGTPTGDEYSWESNIKIKVGTAPTTDEQLKIVRETPLDQQLVDWKDGSYIVADDLNTADLQLLYDIQEITDQVNLLNNESFKFKGTVDLTVDSPPAVPVNGDLYINTGVGTVINGWTGIAGDDVVGAEQVIYNGTDQEWQVIQTPASQSGVLLVSADDPVTVDNTDIQRPVVGINNATKISDVAPSPGVTTQFWFNTTDNRLYIYDGTQWIDASPKDPKEVPIGPTPPSNVEPGDLWWDDVGGVLYIFYQDADSSQWVPATPQPNLNPSLDQIKYTYPGGVEQTAQARLEQYVSVVDYGAKGDGNTDDSSAIENAINGNPQKKVFFPKGTYRVTRTLSITNTSYSMVGERNEKAQNGPSTQFNNAVTIDFEGSAGSWIIDKVVTGNAGFSAGPYEHQNINFLTGVGNGFRFGDESLPVTDSGTGQAYNFGVVFKQCNLQGATEYQPEDAADGTVTLLGTTGINIVKGFECVIEDLSFRNLGTGIRLYGCDKPAIDRIRGQAEVGIECIGVGTFTVQNVINGYQSEGWKFCALRNKGVGMAISDLRLESNRGQSGTTPVTGMGVFELPGVTATATAGSLDVVFSSSMNNIIIPELSLLELETAEGDVYQVLASAVSGTTVTVYGGYFRFTDNLTFTTVRRIHGYGVQHYSSTFGTEITNASPNVYRNCPAFVYASSRSSMHVTNATTETGNSGNNECVALGNMPGEPSFMNPQLVLTACSAILTPRNPNPYIISSNFAHINGNAGNAKQSANDSFNQLRTVQRQWVFTPATMGLTRNNQNLVTWVKIAGDPDTDQSNYAWYLDDSITEPRTLRIVDETLPSVDIGYIGVEIRVRTKSGNSTIFVNAEGNGGGSILNGAPITEDITTIAIKRRRPSQWQGNKTTTTGLRIVTSDPAYIIGVVVTQYLPTDNTFLMSPNGTVYDIGVQNDGTLYATPV